MTKTTGPGDAPGRVPATAVESLTEFTGTELHDLCDAAESAIVAGGGFGWLSVPSRQALEAYWKGVLVVPERELFVARLDQTICGSAQLQRAPRNNEAQALSGTLTTSFMAPWARGHGLARQLVLAVEAAALQASLRILNLDVRESQEAAIKLYETLGYQQWGRHPHYAWVEGHWVPGRYYFKDLRAAMAAGSGG